MKVILVSLLLFVLSRAEYNCDCGWRNAGRIRGGKDTLSNEYPWHAGIGFHEYGHIFCSGALITKWHIITSGYCVFDTKPKEIFLYAGSYLTTKDYITQKRDVKKIIIHPGYKRWKYMNNIAIVMAKKEFVYTEDRFVGPICMPTGQLGDMDGEVVKATGWGSSTMESTSYDDAKYKELKEVDLDVIPPIHCGSINNTICTHTDGKRFGRGDGGDPMVWLDGKRFTLVGIYAGQVRNDPFEMNPLGTNVSAFLDWINEKISSTNSEATTCHKIVN